MLKHIILLIALSVAVVIGMSYAQMSVQWLLAAQSWVSNVLSDVFSGGQAGSIAKGVIALLCIPLLAGLIPTVIYWMIKKNWLPYFITIVWVTWLIQTGALVVLYQTAA